jgi:hypothetical protein
MLVCSSLRARIANPRYRDLGQEKIEFSEPNVAKKYNNMVLQIF